MITIWTKDGDDLAAKEIHESQWRSGINQLNKLMNDPNGSIKEGIKNLQFLWVSITPVKEIRFDMALWRKMMQEWHKAAGLRKVGEPEEQEVILTEPIKMCPERTERWVERTCCGGRIDKIPAYHCNIKNQPTTAIGCRKCVLL